MTREEVIEAIEGSIEKWNNIAFHGGVDRGVLNCPLCLMFSYCKDGCPVYIYSGSDKCRKTPYTDWSMHYNTAHSEYSSFSLEDGKVLCPTCKKMAKKELDYLKKVLIWYEGKKDILKREKAI